ncbi:MAG: hypothetical protein NC177_14720 [Ruminococcus flavefaciens]|nr:hypothetical protein [Ruminococcus flavefaciens]
MSLIRCPKCCKKISNQASSCVRCGYPVRKKKVVCKPIKMSGLESELKAIHEDLNKLHQDELCENSISLWTFKFGIISALVIFLGLMFYAAIKNTFEAFSENSTLSMVILAITIVITAFLICSFIFSHLERKFSKMKKIFSALSKVLCIIICIYIVMSMLLVCVIDLLKGEGALTQCFTSHMLFGSSGLILSLMIEEVWYTKDKNFIFAFIAIICTLVAGMKFR